MRPPFRRTPAATGSDACRLPGPARRERAAGAAAFLGLLGVAAMLPAARPLPIDLCLLHRLTGLPCLTCGMTRSVGAMLRGDPTASFAFHPAGALVVALLLAQALGMGWEAARGRTSERRILDRLTVVLLAAGALVSGVFWIVRLARV